METETHNSLIRAASGVTLAGQIELAMRRYATRPAIREGAHVTTFGRLAERSASLVAGLAALGVGQGDRIAVLSENRTEYLELLVAAARGGFILCAQNWRLAPEELLHCVALVEPKVILASPRFSAKVKELWPQTPLITFGPAYESMASTLAPMPRRAIDPEDGVVILYTSGTTGRPKGALISQRAEVARAAVSAIDIPTSADEAFLAWAPLFHMVSTDPAFGAFMKGAEVIVTDGYDPQVLADLVTKHRLGHLIVMPGMVESFLDALTATGLPPKGVRWVGVMADLLPRHQLQAITTALNAPYVNSFGSTETGSPPGTAGKIAVGALPDNLDKIVNVLCEIRLVDEEDRDVPMGEAGELAIRGPATFSGYWNNPEATSEAFKGGWYHMGDMFRETPEGALQFVDRRKYLIKTGGENVYPAEIEQVLMSLPQVADTVVVRASDPKWGEVPVAFVTLKSPTSAEALLQVCAQRLARYKRPARIIFVEDAELPRSTTGKIMRHLLEEALAQGRFEGR